MCKTESLFGMVRRRDLEYSMHKLGKWLRKYGWTDDFRIVGSKTYYFGDGQTILAVTYTDNQTMTYKVFVRRCYGNHD